MKKVKIKMFDLEKILKTLDFPTVEYLGNGLYRINPSKIICNETFLQKVHEECLKQIIYG